MKAFEVTKEDIEQLDQRSLPNLMKKLLHAELSKLKLKQSELIISLDTNDPDGGVDGYIGSEIPEDHLWLPSGRSGWQFKAVKRFDHSDAEKEVLNKAKTDINHRIKKLLQQGEAYILVIGGKDYTLTKLEEREKRIREVFAENGFPDSKVKVYSSGQIAEWVNSFPSVVAHLKPDRANFKDIKEWKEKLRVIKEPKEFVPDAKREKHIQSVRDAINSNVNRERATIIRLVGLTGIGKTRLIYETLATEELKELVFYTESPDKLPTSRFNEVANNEDITAIFVIDECPHDKYVELAKEVEGIGGRITFISLDYDIDRSRDNDDHIILEKLDDDALDELIQLTVPGLLEMARRKIVEFSEGYPKIAVRLSEHFSSHPDILSPDTLSKLTMDDLFDKMIAGRHAEDSEINKIKKVLTAISLFKRLGWDNELSEQGQNVCKLLGIQWIDARHIINEQEERGLVIKRGRYRYISPLPLAIYLASNWWKVMDESTWSDFYGNLPDLETKKSFLERLTDLPHSEYAKKVLKKKFAEFDYELMDSEIGSEIFLGLTKADHLLAMETLERILGPVPKEKLLEFEAGRRNVVWALEKIAWWPDTFHRAARLLLKLADAENESWSNNATGVFTQLFQTFLGGTAVPAWERHSILEEALNSGNTSLQKLALKGLETSFKLWHATRDVSGEEQGTVIPPPEWNPRYREDLRKSVLSALGILDKAMEMNDSEIQTEAARIFLSHIRILLSRGFNTEVMERLQRIQTKFPELEKELIKTVEEVIHFDSEKLQKEVIDKVRDFRDKLIGGDFKGLMRRYVKSRLLEDELKENRENVDRIVRELVEESVKVPEKLNKEINWLVTSEAENGYGFGRILGELDRDYYWLDIILQAVKDSENPSVYFFGGYLSSIKLQDEDLWEKTLDRCYNDETLKKFLLEIIWRSEASDNAVKLIIRMLKDQVIKPQEIKLLTYGAWFRGVSAKMFIEFLEEYYKIGDVKYASCILGIIDQYVETYPHFISDGKDTLFKYLINPEFFEDSDTMYHWDKLSNKLMEEFDETIPYFLDLVLDTLMKENCVHLESDFRTKLKYFLEKDFDNTWKRIKEALLATDLCAWHLTDILKGDYASFRKEKNSLLGLIPETYIWEWVEENPDNAEYILTRMIPLHESEPLLHPLARTLLTKYPSDEDIASGLSANWRTEGWVGYQRSSYHESKLHIAKNWAEDPEISVANWAKKEVEYLEKQLDIEKREEEEMGV
ncbi:MAG: hypothetical protein DRN14_04730 [Thermoplasmata archaeon]|nr:MAG: hypothetical protein DRN14_04730 [Thermoplasmata archaeon]